MAPKARAQEIQEPPAKKAKSEEEPKAEAREEEKKFAEPDAPKDNRPAVKETVAFTTPETTLNVLPTMGGKLLTAIQDSGMSYLLAGARANVGVKNGRYMFEAKIVQNLTSGGDGRCKPLLKVGFSQAGSSLFLGEDNTSVCFESEGNFVSDKKRVNLPQGKARFGKDKVVAVVLNLDSKSPNANTVCLYVDGEKIADPKPLPEGLKGEPLFPTVTYRNVTVHVNFGPTPLKDLPFKCRMLEGAAASDCTVAAAKEPKDGKYEVVFPVAFPDEGTFDWLDTYLESNPKYVELSDRKLVAWCKSSGLHPKGGKGSNDKPVGNFGVPGLDDFSVRKVVASVAPCIPRNYLVMEVKSNLIAAERKESLKKFNYPYYKKIAHVVLGKPSKDYKAVVQSKMLKEKQAKADAAFKAKQEAAARAKAAEKKKKELEKIKKEAEKKRAAILAEAKKKAGGDADKKEEEEKKEDEPMEEVEEEKPAEEEVAEPPEVELTAEEKEKFFFPKSVPDLDPKVLSANFAKFTTPEEDEGFDSIRYEWDKDDKAEAYLKTWVQNKKLTTRIDDLKPGQFFREKAAAFAKSLKAWQDKQKASKKPVSEELVEDIFAVTDIDDAGAGVPLYDKFTWQDWELVQLRFQFSMLVTCFKKDCNDPDRVGIPLDHVSFYFARYFSKGMNLKAYGVTKPEEVFALIKDTVGTQDNLLVSQLSDDVDELDIFVKLSEEHRRERQRRIDAGDETARLKFIEPPKAPEKKPEAPKAPAPKPEAKAAPKQIAAPKVEPKQAPKMTPAPKKK